MTTNSFIPRVFALSESEIIFSAKFSGCLNSSVFQKEVSEQRSLVMWIYNIFSAGLFSEQKKPQ